MQESEKGAMIVSKMAPSLTIGTIPFRRHTWETPIERIAPKPVSAAPVPNGHEIPQWAFRVARLVLGDTVYGMFKRFARRDKR